MRPRATTRRLPGSRAVAVLLVGAALLGAGCGGEEPRGETIELIIPAGTSRQLERGAAGTGIPDVISGRVGDTLVVVNRDRSTQFIAGFSVSPGQTLRIPLNRAGSYLTDCSAHEDRSIKMQIAP